MNNNEMIMLIVAFVVGFMIRELMKMMCRSRLVEGTNLEDVPRGLVDFWKDKFNGRG